MTYPDQLESSGLITVLIAVSLQGQRVLPSHSGLLYILQPHPPPPSNLHSLGSAESRKRPSLGNHAILRGPGLGRKANLVALGYHVEVTSNLWRHQVHP